MKKNQWERDRGEPPCGCKDDEFTHEIAQDLSPFGVMKYLCTCSDCGKRWYDVQDSRRSVPTIYSQLITPKKFWLKIVRG